VSAAHLVGVSIPRSGHNFLVSLLREIVGTGFRYCEFYTPDDCCRAVPCTRTSGAKVFFQKSHDFDLDVPTDLEGVVYVVQIRDPAMALLSDREYLGTMTSEDLAADRDEYLVWLGRKAWYFEHFFDKWVRRLPESHRVLIEYDGLVENPRDELQRLLAACGRELPEAEIDGAIARTATRAAAPPAARGSTPFVRRSLAASRFLDEELLPVTESLLLDRVPELAGKRRLARVEWDEHPVACVYRAEGARRRGELPEALAEIERGLASAPGNRHLLAERADLLAALERIDEAVTVAEDVLDRAPEDPASLRRLSDLHVEVSRRHLRTARKLAERLVEARPDDAGDRVHLATLLQQLDEAGHAQVQANIALQLGARDADVWRYASEVFVACRNLPAAIEAVRGAIVREPGRPEYQHHLANLLALSGHDEEAEAAHRRAIEMAPDRPNWRWKRAEDLRLAGREAEALGVVRDALNLFPDHPLLRRQLDSLTRA
jgi:tetratricopeptide (TPR) repeat protein